MPLRTFVDTSWMGQGNRYHHGFITTIWPVPPTWSANRQAMVARSTYQAEYIARLAGTVDGKFAASYSSEPGTNTVLSQSSGGKDINQKKQV